MDHSVSPTPLSPSEPLPHRKIIRSWLIPLSERNTLRPLLMLVLDYSLWIALLCGVVFARAMWLKALCGLTAGFVMGRLFIIGHDACHQSLTPHRSLNRWLGRIAFLATLTPYSVWDVGHNVVHHGFTNLKGVDFVWEPLTDAEFQALSPTKRFMHRLYRSGWAPGLYYMIEIWWNRMMFPRASSIGASREIFMKDSWLATVFGAIWLAVLAFAAEATDQSVLSLWLWGFVVPMQFWFAMIGFVVYVHHTHRKISWHEDKATWSKAQPFVSTTVHLTFPFKMGAMMHHIMEHTAHHVDMSIPLYRLEAAQEKLEELLPGRIVVQRFSWAWYFETARACKLFDFKRKCWTDFEGHSTSLA